jgi:hypothetical protein
VAIVREKAFRRLTPEKVAFYVTSAWLLAMGLNYARAPDVARWGPATTGHMDVGFRPVDLEALDPLDLGGDDGDDPFGDEDEPPEVVEVVVTGGETIDDQVPEEETKEKALDMNAGGETTGQRELTEEEDTETTALLSFTPKGSVAVGGGDRWFVFEDESTGRYQSAREGEEIDALGLRVVGNRDRAPVVEPTPPHSPGGAR